MAYTPYYFGIVHGPRTRMRLLMNGVPFYRCVPDPLGASHNGALNHTLVPGENVVTMEIFEAEESFATMLEININLDHKSPVLHIVWPEVWTAPRESRSFPFRQEFRFNTTGVEFVPTYLGAPRADFGPAGTAELREAVRRYHDVVARGDTEGFIQEIDLQLREMKRAYEHNAAFDVQDLRSVLNERFRSGVWARPLNFDEVVFESFVHGRVAHVTRIDGGPGLHAIANNGDEMEADLWLTRENGIWRVFR